MNWTDHGTINVARSGGAASWAGNSWAPCAVHKTINGKEKFFLYFANNANGIGVLTADSPTGPWRDPIGKASNPKTARVVKLGADMTSLAGTPQTIDAPWIFEDSGINKIGNTYYYSYCTNWSGGPLGNARIAYMTSNSPMGPFTSKGVCFKNQGEFLGDGGNNHHTIIPFKNKYYIFYHSETLNKQVYGSCLGYRTTFVNEMPYSNGTLGQAKATMQGVAQVQNLNPYVSNRAATIAWQGGILVNGSGANTIVSYNRGDWTGVSGVAFGNSGATAITMKAASQNGAVIKICDGSASGTAIGYVTIPVTGSNNTYKTVTANINKVTGTKKVFFVASGDVNVDSWQFSTNGTVPSISPSVKPSVAPSKTPSGTTGLPAGVTCEYSIVSDWGSGFQGQIVLSNKSSHTFNGWTLSFDYNSKITSLWGAELAYQTGNNVVVKNPSWDATLAPGASVTINFVAELGSDKNAPTNCSLM